jgi:hypothetical protein
MSRRSRNASWISSTRSEQRPRLVDDRIEDAVGVALRGEIARRLHQRGQLGLASPTPVEVLADAQGQVALGLRGVQRGDLRDGAVAANNRSSRRAAVSVLSAVGRGAMGPESRSPVGLAVHDGP